MRKVLAAGVLFLGVVLAAWLLWPGSPKDDEALIRQMVAEVARAASAKDVRGVVEHVSEQYRGEAGDRQGLKGLLFMYMQRSDWVTALPVKVEVSELEETKARLSMVVLLARTPAERAEDLATGEIAGSHRIEAEVAKEDGQWRVVSAQRQDAGPADFL